jgi:large subunit ribosomal protein L9e
MKLIKVSESVEIPGNVDLSVKTRNVTVTGPRGTITKNFQHSRIEMNITTSKKGVKTLHLDMYFGNRKERARLRTIKSHINNMITGVTKGYEYKMRLVYAHFPINVNFENDDKDVAIRNFLGEKKVMNVRLDEGVKCERSADVKDQLVLSGIDINAVSQSAANIQQKCRVKSKDIRKFLDGIYVSERGNVDKAL